jgi:hypothetical protein
MKYIILDWTHRRYCPVSAKIPDRALPGGLVCRNLDYILQGRIDLKEKWSYEPSFKKHEKKYLSKNRRGLG